MKPKFYYSIFAGKPKYERPEQREAFLKGISKKPNIRYVETHEKYIAKRSLAQNAYYWGVVVDLISKETGQDKDSAHDGLRQMFLKVHDEKLPTIQSTTKLTTVEFVRYIDECVLFAAEFLQIIIPPPPYKDERTQNE